MWATTTLALYGVGGAAIATSLVKLRRRFDLSQAKHKSLAGHARIARRLASFVPFYDYDDEQFFCCDGAPAEVAARRRAGFERLSALYKTRFADGIRRTAEAADSISDLQFTDSYRVPFQFSHYVRTHLPAAAFMQSSAGVTVTDLDGNRFYDVSGSYGVNVLGYDFYKGAIERGAARAARAWAGARPLSSCDRREREAAEGDFRPRRGVVSYVRHRSGHAGGPAGALPHKAIASGAVLRRLSWLVGRRATGHRQSASRARDLYAARYVRGYAAGSAHAAQHRLRAGQSAAGAASRTRRAPSDSALARQRVAAPISTRTPMPIGSGACARSAASRTSS